jgi:peptidoglycan/LPS O-acetylase OafA/YrhL
MKIYNNNIVAVKVLAALQVSISHYFSYFNVENFYIQLFSSIPGVPIFFMMSGYLLAQQKQLFPESISNNKMIFYRKRLLRIFPALYVSVTISIILLLFTSVKSYIQIPPPFLFNLNSPLCVAK